MPNLWFWRSKEINGASEGEGTVGAVDAGFNERVRATLEPFGGSVLFVEMRVSREEQERRIGNASRLEFGKLTSLDLLRELRCNFDASLAHMPAAEITIDTEACGPVAAAKRIATYLSTRKAPGGRP